MPSGWTAVAEPSGWTPVVEKPKTLDERQGNTSKGKPKVDPSKIPDEGIFGALFTPVRGAQQVASGVQRMNRPEEGETRGGLSDIVQGGLKVLSPYAPQAILSNIPRALLAMAGGALGDKAGSMVADATEASPGSRELLQTGGQVVGGSAGAALEPTVRASASSLMESAKKGASAVVDAARNPVVKEAIGLVSPRAAHAVNLANKAFNIADAVRNAAGAPAEAAPLAEPVANVGAEIANAPTLPANTPTRSKFFPQQVEGTKKLFPKAEPITATPEAMLQATKPSNVVPISGPPEDAMSTLMPSPAYTKALNSKPGAAEAAKAFAEAMMEPEAPKARVLPELPNKSVRIPKSSAVNSAYLEPESTGLGIPQVDTSRSAVAGKLADALHKGGITSKDIEALAKVDPEEAKLFWNNTGRIDGVSKQEHYAPSVETQERVLAELKRLEQVKRLSAKLSKEMQSEKGTVGDLMKGTGK